ncbi:MAG: hypothetical protein D6772_13225 [Bacteroidetes bacterium]|nr:MAG: hypothetical protein D6772_13225 [Bacteroidota bacterium]
MYELVLELLVDQHLINQHASAQDYLHLLNDNWLLDSAVQEEVVRRSGMWCIHLIFLHPKRPMQFCRRFIVAQVQENKARLMATYMRRLAAKDQRGTIRVSPQRYTLCCN